MSDELDPGFIAIEQQVDLGGQVLSLTGKVNLIGLSAAQREVLLDILDAFARLGSKTRTRERVRATRARTAVPQEEEEGGE
jgi:hypothetical protein